MAEEPPEQPIPQRVRPPDAGRRPNVTILLSFLGAFLLLLVVFRTVLFPFLMAMFVAYLIEPLVQWMTRSRLFGFKWTRGPIIVLVYVLVLGGVFVLGWQGATRAATLMRNTAQDISDAAKEKAYRIDFALTGDNPHPKDVVIPSGTLVHIVTSSEAEPALPEDERPGRYHADYRTLYETRIPAGETRTSALLEFVASHGEASAGVVSALSAEAVIAFADGSALPEDRGIEIRAGMPSKGLELWVERNFTTPIVENLQNAGMEFEPTGIREFVSHKAEAWGADLPERLSRGAVSWAGRIALSVYEFFLILMLTAFIVTDRKGIAQFFASMPPPKYKPAYQRLVRYVDDGLAGVIRGQLVICGVNGVLTYIGLLLIGVKGALLLSVIAAVLSLIPIFGTIVSSIPIVLIAATAGIEKGVYALLWIVFIHMLEANLLNPLIMGSHARMHPVVIVFALLAGEHSFGVWGALLAVPTMSIIQSCFRFYLHEIEGIPEEEPKPHGAWIRARLASFFALFKKKEAAS